MGDIQLGDSGIIMLKSSKEADAKLKSPGPLMMIYYAKWCGHCQSSFEDWKKLSKKQKGKVFMIESENCPEVTSFPTIKIKNGKVSDYNGERTVEAMEKALLGSKKGGLRSCGGRLRRGGGTCRFGGRVRKAHRTLRRNVAFV
jgi:thiol-disulfide isomerase/thioredoxin